MQQLIFILFILTSSFLIFSCDQDVNINENLTGISLSNKLDVTIDTLAFVFSTGTGTDSVLFLQTEALMNSDRQYFEQAKYYFRQSEDIFLISEGFYSIDGERFDLSNCFCDPELNQGILPPGHYVIEVNGIDPLRNIVNYIITQE